MSGEVKAKGQMAQERNWAALDVASRPQRAPERPAKVDTWEPVMTGKLGWDD